MKHILTPLILTLCLTMTASAQTPDTTPLPPYPRVEVETNAGTFVLELFTSRAPITVENFIQYVNEGFYNGTVFHRVVGGFVIQGGGYDENYKLKPTRQTISNESGNGLSNQRGFVAMARTGDPHSADSQFYINLNDNTALDPRPTRWGYTVFGKVVEGMETVDEIGYLSTGAGPVPELAKDVPKEPVVITGVTVIVEDSADSETTDATPVE